MSMNAGTSDRTLEERLTFIGIDEAARERLKSLQPVIAQAAGPALDHFYARVRETPETSRFFSGEGHIAGAKARQEKHWTVIAQGRFDDAYIEGVGSVGKAHARLGLEPRWYIGGYALILEQLIGAIVEARWPSRFGKGNTGALAADVATVVKAALLDMDYAISVYLEVLADERQRAEDARARAEADQKVALEALGRVMSLLAGGDLQARMSSGLPENFAEMARNYNEAVEALRATLVDVRSSADQISTGVDGIAHAADDLSHRTEQQAASLEQSSAALHELTESVKLTADSAQKASAVVETAKSEADRSGDVVGQAVAAMGAIEKSSDEIAKIIGVIDEIAFQTNLLALNAGVEAARAGEAGRGFAVVAQEVRELAQRCAGAAREIKELIRISSEQVKSGVSLVDGTGTALGSIITRISQINDLMGGIAAAAREQSIGLHEVNSAVTQMDQIVQRNAAMVEETTAEAHSLKAEAARLADQMGRFTIAPPAERESASAARAVRAA